MSSAGARWPPRQPMRASHGEGPRLACRRRPIAPGRPARMGSADGRMRTHAHARSGSARWPVFLAGRGRNGDRRGRASLLGGDPGAGVRDGARAVRRRSCGHLRHGGRHGGRRPARSPGWPCSPSRPRCGLRRARIRALRWWRGGSNSPPRSRSWRSASRSCSARAARPDRRPSQAAYKKAAREGRLFSVRIASAQAAMTAALRDLR